MPYSRDYEISLPQRKSIPNEIKWRFRGIRLALTIFYALVLLAVALEIFHGAKYSIPLNFIQAVLYSLCGITGILINAKTDTKIETPAIFFFAALNVTAIIDSITIISYLNYYAEAAWKTVNVRGVSSLQKEDFLRTFKIGIVSIEISGIVSITSIFLLILVRVIFSSKK
eukprot:NODE_658_length_5456_cov_0.429158.p4 type:complete len:170 gc:universal NODE_658_length_5456_cov_0.429158:704-195(-)